MSALTTTEQNRNTLATTLDRERDYVATVIPLEKVDEFKSNYLELAQNTYLMDKISPKEILTTAVNATALGVNVNPIYKEAYILPFNVKGKGMVASIVVSKDGHVQMAFQSGFYLRIDNVWSINGQTLNESEMKKEQLMLLKTTNLQFVKEHLVGWEISLEDISLEDIKVPMQSKFVGLDYVLEVTKQLQTPEHSIQTWVHKAVRRAMTDMFIPRHRKSLMMEKIEAYNNQKEHGNLIEAESKEAPIDPLAGINNDVVEAVIEESVTIEDIKKIYANASPEAQAGCGAVFVDFPNWRKETNQEELQKLHATLKGYINDMAS
ncbi:MAG: hypothetical protein GQ474_01580 [Sulfurimonas sp.]|nr:hypothetical protein [Sulfurimonas sp.]